jgi:hypothetical protein
MMKIRFLENSGIAGLREDKDAGAVTKEQGDDV